MASREGVFVRVVLLIATILAGGAGAVEPQAGDRVRVRTQDNSRHWHEGRLLNCSSQNIVLLAKGDTITVRRDQIDRLQSHAGTGSAARTGAIVGGFVGGATAYGITTGVDWGSLYEKHEPSTGTILGVSALGALLGAMVGSAIGSSVETDQWEDQSLCPALIMNRNGTPGLAVAWNF